MGKGAGAAAAAGDGGDDATGRAPTLGKLHDGYSMSPSESELQVWVGCRRRCCPLLWLDPRPGNTASDRHTYPAERSPAAAATHVPPPQALAKRDPTALSKLHGFKVRREQEAATVVTRCCCSHLFCLCAHVYAYVYAYAAPPLLLTSLKLTLLTGVSRGLWLPGVAGAG
jgi:hypothetical protein